MYVTVIREFGATLSEFIFQLYDLGQDTHPPYASDLSSVEWDNNICLLVCCKDYGIKVVGHLSALTSI